jgi:hypothetical protein
MRKEGKTGVGLGQKRKGEQSSENERDRESH